MEQLEGKVAVVTGAASGIGFALAKAFVAEGMKVAMGDIEQDALDAAAAELRDKGGDVMAFTVDVAAADEVDRFRDAVLESFGAVHVVCNNAGVGSGGLLWELSDAQWQWVVGVDLFGVVNGIRAFVPKLVAQNEGHVVNTASIAGMTSTPGMGPYNAAKHGVVTISETLFHELRMFGASNVGVSVLCPGFVRTRIAESDRNAPAELRSSQAGDPQAEGMRSLIQTMIESGIDPDEVARQVLDAIKNRRFYIFTHPESINWVRARFDAILEGKDPVSGFG
ncbi:MAG: SDR family NAD(P)-dependent oxidoreductase [Acidimicrobiales bacterium]|nr:SDR family NAD(P)-dependent oxidoreductase [Acidimicrobiales bacterium]